VESYEVVSLFKEDSASRRNRILNALLTPTSSFANPLTPERVAEVLEIFEESAQHTLERLPSREQSATISRQRGSRERATALRPLPTTPATSSRAAKTHRQLLPAPLPTTAANTETFTSENRVLDVSNSSSTYEHTAGTDSVVAVHATGSGGTTSMDWVDGNLMAELGNPQPHFNDLGVEDFNYPDEKDCLECKKGDQPCFLHDPDEPPADFWETFKWETDVLPDGNSSG
jgi:hypothetical protein